MPPPVRRVHLRLWLHHLRHQPLPKLGDRVALWLAWRLPRKLVMYCYLRVVSNGAAWENTTVPAERVAAIVINRWEGHR